MREPAAETDTITHSASIYACEGGAQWPRALGLLAQMQELAAEPNTIIHGASISAREEGSRRSGAPGPLPEAGPRGGSKHVRPQCPHQLLREGPPVGRGQ